MNPSYSLILAAIGFGVFLLLFRRARQPSKPPEEKWTVELKENSIACTGPEGAGVVNLGQLRKVEILTTGRGPFAPDVFWIVHDDKGKIAFPQGAIGEKAVMDAFFQLPEFDLEASILASFSAEHQIFHCWPKR